MSYYQLIQQQKVKQKPLELLSETKSLPPLLSSDIALSILTVKVVLSMRYVFSIFNYMVTSLKKEYSILIYEKEKLLNSILYYQISNHNNFKVSITDNNLEMFEVLNKKKFDTCIINLNFLNGDLKKFYDIFEINNNHNNIIGYYEHNFENSFFAKDKIISVEKTF